jgi:hypothetical protein
MANSRRNKDNLTGSGFDYLTPTAVFGGTFEEIKSLLRDMFMLV